MAKHRSAITGRYLSAAAAARHPRTSVRESSAKSSNTRTVNRSAITGKFVKEATAKRHPKTTLTERV